MTKDSELPLRRVFGSLAPTLQRYVKPAIGFSLTQERIGRSRFGGKPLLTKGFEWPWYTPKKVLMPPGVMERLGMPQPREPTPRPIDFLLQVDLAELPECEAELLPRAGLLTFFYDVENQPWGFDPDNLDGFRVILIEESVLTETASPSSDLLSNRGIQFHRSFTLPHMGSRAYERLENEIDLPEDYHQLTDDFERPGYPPDGGLHRMFGHSANVQNDMQLEAQLVTNGLYCGDSSGYGDLRARALESGADDWELLLQLDSDDSAEIMWGDVGMLYFWIRRQDLAARRFARVWMTLQCG